MLGQARARFVLPHGHMLSAPNVFEESGVWVVRIATSYRDPAVQEYRCSTETMARDFAHLFAGNRPFPPRQGQLADALAPAPRRRWWSRS
jgi:hypothetical protein